MWRGVVLRGEAAVAALVQVGDRPTARHLNGPWRPTYFGVGARGAGPPRNTAASIRTGLSPRISE